MGNKKGNRLTVRTREALIGAYIELLHEKRTPEKIKIKEICERAGLSRRTFYSHFETKEEILLTYLDEILDEMFVDFRNRRLEEKGSVANFPIAATRFFQLWQSQAELYSLIKQTKSEELLINKLKEHHLKTYYIIADHVFPVEEPEILNYFISHISMVFYGVLDEWMGNGMKRTPEEVGRILGGLFDPMTIKNMSDQFN
jgi:AcrR family transcriptional regulator